MRREKWLHARAGGRAASRGLQLAVEGAHLARKKQHLRLCAAARRVQRTQLRAELLDLLRQKGDRLAALLEGGQQEPDLPLDRLDPCSTLLRYANANIRAGIRCCGEYIQSTA